jgi:hypothetical protein
MVVTWVRRMFAMEDCMVLIQWEPPTHDKAHDFFMSFAMSDSGMYEELGIRTRHVVQGSRAVVF